MFYAQSTSAVISGRQEEEEEEEEEVTEKKKKKKKKEELACLEPQLAAVARLGNESNQSSAQTLNILLIQHPQFSATRNARKWAWQRRPAKGGN